MKRGSKALSFILCLSFCLALLSPTARAASSTSYHVPDNENWSKAGLYGSICRLEDGIDVSGSFTYTIPEGGVTMMLFFSTTCGNCQADFYALSQQDWIRDPRLNILAFETNDSTAEQTKAFMDNYAGPAQAYIHTYYGQGCASAMWRYFSLTINDTMLTWPLIIMVTKTGGAATIRYASMGYQNVSDLHSAVDTLLQEASQPSPSPSPTPTPAPQPDLFADVADPSAYFYEPVYWARENGITTGTSPTTFSPYAACTRGQIVTFLWRVMGQPSPASWGNPFKDVKPSDYYYTPVLWAYHSGVTTGTSPTTFAPNKACTREQCVTFLWRAAGRPDTSPGTQFKDVKGDAYYAVPVYWALSHGITTGVAPTSFGVGQKCTRGQIVTFLYRYAPPTASK